MDRPRTRFWYHCTVDGRPVHVEMSVEGLWLRGGPQHVRREDEYRLCEYVIEQHKFASERKEVQERFIPAPSARGWKGTYRYEEYHWTFGEIPSPGWLSKMSQ